MTKMTFNFYKRACRHYDYVNDWCINLEKKCRKNTCDIHCINCEDDVLEIIWFKNCGIRMLEREITRKNGLLDQELKAIGLGWKRMPDSPRRNRPSVGFDGLITKPSTIIAICTEVKMGNAKLTKRQIICATKCLENNERYVILRWFEGKWTVELYGNTDRYGGMLRECMIWLEII